MKLWPKAIVRPIRFHDLRHTTASLLLMSGASPAAVQRIMRHSDPRITMAVYGHLEPHYLRAEVDRLNFDLDGSAPTTTTPSTQRERRSPLGAPLVPDASSTAGNMCLPGETIRRNLQTCLLWARRDSNPLPPASEATGDAAWQFGPAQNL
jgi:hypothetical protein